MAYRTKIFKKLVKDYLEPILDFEGIAIDDDVEYGFLKFLGAGDEDRYLINEHNENKRLVIVQSEEQFIKYKMKKDELENFNPFLKYKHALYLLYLIVPAVYEKVSDFDDSIQSAIKGVVEDELNVSQEELMDKIDIIQLPTVNNIYTFEAKIKNRNGDISRITVSDENKIASIFSLLASIVWTFDAPTKAINESSGDISLFQKNLNDLLIRYEKERQLNRKDATKDAEALKEDDITYYTSDDDLLPEDEAYVENEEEEYRNGKGTLNVGKYVAETISIQPKDSDSEFDHIVFI